MNEENHYAENENKLLPCVNFSIHMAVSVKEELTTFAEYLHQLYQGHLSGDLCFASLFVSWVGHNKKREKQILLVKLFLKRTPYLHLCWKFQPHGHVHQP